MTWKTEEHYYSGQGQVLLAARNPDGSPAGFLPLGNVSELKIAVATSVIEHKESQTGARGIDKRLTTEVKCNLSMTIDNFIRTNLATALRGVASAQAASSVVAQAHTAYLGKITSLGKIKVSAVAPKIGAAALTAYVNDTTAWDYRVNTEMGSLQWNDGALVGFGANMGVAITAVTVGTTTTLTAANTFVAGDKVYLQGLTGAGASALNGKMHTVVSSTGTAFVISTDTSALTITATGTPKFIAEKTAVVVDFTWADNYIVEALTQPATELFMRFEGLNTAESNDPVVVEVFKFSTDPLKELSMITDTFQMFQLEGSVLADLGRPTGTSPYFNVRKTN
jgi:hypothetical protein